MKKGFTLAELIGVITILALICLLVMPNILSEINKNKTELSESVKKMIYSSTELYISNNKQIYPKYNGYIYCIQIDDLVENDLLDSNLKDPVTNNNISTDDYIKVSVNNTYNYEIVNECTPFPIDMVDNILTTYPVISNTISLSSTDLNSTYRMSVKLYNTTADIYHYINNVYRDNYSNNNIDFTIEDRI